jgi:hypothetical protein
MKKGIRLPAKVYIALLMVFLLCLPPLVGNYWTQILGDIGIYVILGLGLNVVVGFAGLLDLGYVAFYAMGAYGYALMASPQFDLHIPFWVMLPVCVALAAGGGALLGIPVLRMRGDYLAIVTLGFGEIIRILLNNMDAVTNGPRGLLRIDPPTLGDWVIHTPARWYYVILCAILLSAFVADRLNNSRIGRAWIAMREDQDAAAVMGIDILKYKLLRHRCILCRRGRRHIRREAGIRLSRELFPDGVHQRALPDHYRRHGEHPGRHSWGGGPDRAPGNPAGSAAVSDARLWGPLGAYDGFPAHRVHPLGPKTDGVQGLNGP